MHRPTVHRLPALGAAVTAAGLAATALFAASSANAAPVNPLAGHIVRGQAVADAITAARPVVVTSGLNNPRQLSLLPGGNTLLVAEAGAGGSDCIGNGPDGPTCIGATSSVTAVTAPRYAKNVAPTRVLTGLLSAAGPDGSGAVGADGVSALTLAQIYTQETYYPVDVLPAPLPGEQSGKLLRNPAYRDPKVFADITGYERAHDPDGQGFDSDPYAVLALPGRTLVADAAANDVLSVSPQGVVSLFAVLPNITTQNCAGRPNDNGTTGCDYVPTSLAQGPDGAIYVGGLGGLVKGAGRVTKLDQYTGATLKVYTALTAVTGVAVGPDNSVYASQLAFDPTQGKVTRILQGGTRVDSPVPFPAGIAVDAATGGVYVAAFSIAPSGGLGVPGTDSSGQVWRLRYTTTSASGMPALPSPVSAS